MSVTSSDALVCQHCDGQIRASCDACVPYIHTASGNSYCDVSTPNSAVSLAALNFTGMRAEASPASDQED